MFGISTISFSSAYVTSLLYENGILLLAAILCATPLSHNLFEALRRKMQATWGPYNAYAVDRVIKTALVILLLAICTIRLVGDSYNPFIYFKF